jgi:hypothetical protein
MEKPINFEDAVESAVYEYVHQIAGGAYITTFDVVNFFLEKYKGEEIADDSEFCRARLETWIDEILGDIGYCSAVKYTGEGSTGFGKVWRY